MANINLRRDNPNGLTNQQIDDNFTNLNNDIQTRMLRDTQFPPNNNWNDALTNGFYMSAHAANAPTPDTWYIGMVEVQNSLWVKPRGILH